MTIQKKLLKQAKGLDFTSVEELFDYVIQSKINGNSTQVSNLIKAFQRKAGKCFYLMPMGCVIVTTFTKKSRLFIAMIEQLNFYKFSCAHLF